MFYFFQFNKSKMWSAEYTSGRLCEVLIMVSTLLPVLWMIKCNIFHNDSSLRFKYSSDFA